VILKCTENEELNVPRGAILKMEGIKDLLVFKLKINKGTSIVCGASI
jgi:hypothetical protein